MRPYTSPGMRVARPHVCRRENRYKKGPSVSGAAVRFETTGTTTARPAPTSSPICTAGPVRWLGGIVEGQVRLTPAGEIVRDEWRRSKNLREGLVIDAFVIMPDHLHGIVGFEKRRVPLQHGEAARHPGLPRRQPASLGSFVAGFKASASSRLLRLPSPPPYPFWQRGYHERILPDEAAMAACRAYIARNPERFR